MAEEVKPAAETPATEPPAAAADAPAPAAPAAPAAEEAKPEAAAAKAPAAPSWADEVEEEGAGAGGDAVGKLSEAVKEINLDVGGAPDLHTGELVVREAGCEEGQHVTEPVTSFNALDIDDSLKKAIAEVKGWQTMSKIQQIGLPLVLKNPPLNLIGQAQAGTGKTGTFVVSMLARIDPAEAKPSCPQGIILCVSQELCTQIAQEVNALGSFKGIQARRVMSSHSKTGSRSDTPWKLEKGEDFMEQVVVGTYGMVLNYLKNASGRQKKKPCIDASNVKVLVLDEADNMLQAPSGDDVNSIRSLILKKRGSKPCQMLLFSATFTEELRQVARRFAGGDRSDRSLFHEISLRKEDVTLEKVINFYTYIGDGNERDEEAIYEKKYKAITEIWASLSEYNLGQTVIFCNRKARVNSLTEFLRKEQYAVGQIHGDMNKAERDTVLAEFKSGERKVLVSTNVTSRGIDNPNVTLVINVDLPTTLNREPDPENFVHRIGRSGRWTKKGASVSLVARSSISPDQTVMNEIERALFANKEVNRPLILVEDITEIGEKLAAALNNVN